MQNQKKDYPFLLYVTYAFILAHIHFSKIMYGNKGEIKHLTFADTLYGPEFEPLCDAILKLDLDPHIICESDGTQAEDTMTMKKYYLSRI